MLAERSISNEMEKQRLRFFPRQRQGQNGIVDMLVEGTLTLDHFIWRDLKREIASPHGKSDLSSVDYLSVHYSIADFPPKLFSTKR